jgi:alpha-beta hydrolase superfamily lysophospholipase
LEKNNNSLHTIKDANFLSSSDSKGESAHCYVKYYYPKKALSKKIIHVIFQHGAIEYHKRHEEFFDALRVAFGNKLVISCFDLVGHGFSGGSRAYVKDFKTYIDDFLKFTRTTQDLYREHEVETHIVAHSLGGMIVLKTLVDFLDQIPFKVHSLTMTNPCINPKITLPKFATDLLLNLSERLGKMRLPSLYDGFDLTTDRERAIAHKHDHLNSNFMTIRMASEIIKTSKEITPYSYYLQVPVLCILSGNDVIVDSQATKLFLSGLDKSKMKEIYYPDAKHDILNEVCRADVFQEIIEYIKFKDWERQCVD